MGKSLVEGILLKDINKEAFNKFSKSLIGVSSKQEDDYDHSIWLLIDDGKPTIVETNHAALQYELQHRKRNVILTGFLTAMSYHPKTFKKLIVDTIVNKIKGTEETKVTKKNDSTVLGYFSKEIFKRND